jgi:hypothetical protein
MNTKFFGYQRILFAFALTLIMSGCANQHNEDRLPADLIQNPRSAEGSKENLKMPIFEFEREFHDFGRVIQGEQVSYGFKFSNSGEAALLISSVSSSCGCAVASYPNHPMKPGEKGTITVRFDSRGRRGIQVKTITLIANTQPNKQQLSIQANVVTPERD